MESGTSARSARLAPDTPQTQYQTTVCFLDLLMMITRSISRLADTTSMTTAPHSARRRSVTWVTSRSQVPPTARSSATTAHSGSMTRSHRSQTQTSRTSRTSTSQALLGRLTVSTCAGTAPPGSTTTSTSALTRLATTSPRSLLEQACRSPVRQARARRPRSPSDRPSVQLITSRSTTSSSPVTSP